MATSMAAVCPGCFRHKGGEIAVCPGCGYDAAASRSPLLLPVLTRLNQRYLVGRTLGKPGGFGVTYLGFDVTLRVKVAIKEYCPRELVGRDASRKTLAPHSHEDGELFRFGLQAFLDEARTLAKFDHANVVRVRDFFEANGTAYLVMDYYEGESLLEYLARQGGTLPWRVALNLMLPVLDGLREVHRHGFLHRDIKPHNIYLTTQGRPILLDFGSARQAMGERSRSLSVVLTEGYAPFEQYHSKGQQGPWTDIYGAAATIYLLLTGQTPPPAPERIRGDDLIPPRQLVPDLPPPLNAALVSALAMDALQRPQTMEQFEEWLHGMLQGLEVNAIPVQPSEPVKKRLAKLEVSSIEINAVSIKSKETNNTYKKRAIIILGLTIFIISISYGWYLLMEQQAEKQHIEAEAAARQQAEAAARQQAEAAARQQAEAAARQQAESANRYRDNKDGTVTDTKTGLQWMRCASGQKWTGQTCIGTANEYKWQAALDMANFINNTQNGYAGYKDWRIPNKLDLRTLVYCSSNSDEKGQQECQGLYEIPTIYQSVFPNTPGDFFWSSSSSDVTLYGGDFNQRAMNGDLTLVISFKTGRGVYYSTISDNYVAYIRFVRGGQQ